ncbi:MAG: hypothetical protein J6E48_06110 [Prevotella sp.]|nr:hypothetical protein [Prevotella sp.]
MTIIEAIDTVLKQRGGRAKTGDICKEAVKLLSLKGETPENSVRSELYRHPQLFRKSPNKPAGWWEFVSFQEEIAALKAENERLRAENGQLLSIPKESEFVGKFIVETMNEYKFRRVEADPIRNILRHMGKHDAVEVLDAWMEEKDAAVEKALQQLSLHVHNINMTGDHATYSENNVKYGT